jgi:hypothetical protein
MTAGKRGILAVLVQVVGMIRIGGARKQRQEQRKDRRFGFQNFSGSSTNRLEAEAMHGSRERRRRFVHYTPGFSACASWTAIYLLG